jgi:hypothetical protein
VGTQLVNQVVALTMAGRLPGLSDGARLCLLGMASHAHDTGTKTIDQGLYFHGWEHLAVGWLGYPKLTDAAERRMTRMVNELRQAGLIEPVAWRGSSRGPRVYRLHIWLSQPPVDN